MGEGAMSECNDINRLQADNEQVRNRALRLFTFLREITELRTKTTRTSDQYEKVLWFNDIPREPGCHCIAWHSDRDLEESDVWAEIKKPRLKAPPNVPEVLKPWLDPREVEDSSREMPDLRERITITVQSSADEGGERTEFRELAECPEIKPSWERYVQEAWWPWAEEDRKLQAVQEVYTDLFSIYQKQQRLGEAHEVVLGLGYLTWRTPGGYEVKRHIITAQTNLSFDAGRGVIFLGPAGEGAKPTLEQDMLEPQERPNPAEQTAIEHQVGEIGDALWDGVQIHAVLKAWVHAVSSRGQYDEVLIPDKEVGPDPRIRLAPAVILRKRTERSLLRLFQEIIQQMRDGHPVPIGIRRLVTIMDDSGASFGGDGEENKPPSASIIEEIYFPLPANAEQLEIAQKISARQGILVQGPPGTGKSHTIANLVCHLLATGQRVLITSHTSRALKALLDKFKQEIDLKEIAGLCVILLGDDLDAMQALEDSVRGITDHSKNWNPDKNQQLIIKLKKELEEIRKAEAFTLAELRAIRELETHPHPPLFGGYAGTAQSIATRVKEEEPRYSWLPIQPEENDHPPLTDTEAIELIRLLREIDGVREQELSTDTIDPDSLVSPSEFSSLIRKEAEAIARFEAAAPLRVHPSYVSLAGITLEQREAFITGLSDLLKTYEVVAHHVQPWVKEAALQILADHDRAWRELLTVTKDTLGAIGSRVRQASQWQITGLGDRDRGIVKAHATDLLSHLEQGGRFGFGPFRPKVVKEGLYLLKEVRIDGHICDEPYLLRNLIEWITITFRLDMLRARWATYTRLPSGPFSTQVEEYKDICEPLEKALELHEKTASLKEMIASIRGLRGLQEPTWHDTESLRELEKVANAVALEEGLKLARKSLESLESHLLRTTLSSSVHPAVKQALEAVRSRDEKRYIEAYKLLCDLQRARSELEHRRALLHRLGASCPALTAQVTANFTDPVWDERMAGFVAAWNWARAERWLKRFSDPQAQQKLSRALERHRTRLRELIRDLAAAKAWRHCLSRLTESERQHLEAWTQAMKRIGKGTGKYAGMHRKAAREHMEQCRSAIPAWIMPIYRVAETIRPGVDAFDVVIVDEASQSGPEALFLQYLAKKIVVVGDDKQISPDSVGITREDVELLRQRHILDIPHSDALGVDNSFFDQAAIRFGGRIRLLEHFRCMPEIIQFSNALCYRSEPLIPLRQYGAGRLTPVIVTHHVHDGYLKGHSPRTVNPPEAEAMANQITKLCNSQAYDGKSMGVISLLGEDQARFIERLLLGKIGPEEMEKRNLVCGDAYAFQGTERDIMFLSLVAAPTEGRRIGTLATQRDERRFNVAASRARDQMWLFHTATLSDLSPNCLRYRLLEYCQNPTVEPTTVGGLNIEELRVIARTADRSRDLPPSPFDSWFEVDVCLMIVGRGFRVIPQFEIAGRRIDLLIEGMRGRLAVECDGDKWHGAERYEEDVSRERMLIRCGLTFWRVRGSTYYRDPEAALENLWETLNVREIYPAGHNGVKAPVKPNANHVSPEHGTSRQAVGANSYEKWQPQRLFSSPEPLFEIAAGNADRETADDPPAASSSHIDFVGNVVPEEATDTGDDTVTAAFLTPYRKWTPKPLPEPSSVPLDDIAKGLVEIISVEGPMLCHRAYHLYAKAAGIGRVGRQIRSIFNRAIRKAVKLGFIEERNECETRDQLNQIVRKAGSPAVVLRTRGDRTFDEIPPAEINEMISQLRRHNSGLEGEELLRSVLDHFRIRRMTSNIRAILMRIMSNRDR